MNLASCILHKKAPTLSEMQAEPGDLPSRSANAERCEMQMRYRKPGPGQTGRIIYACASEESVARGCTLRVAMAAEAGTPRIWQSSLIQDEVLFAETGLARRIER